MLKKSFLVAAATLFLSFLIIPGAFASTPQCVYNGKLNTSCAKKMNLAQLENLKEQLENYPKTAQNDSNLTEVKEIIAQKFAKDKGLYNIKGLYNTDRK
jgi:hypothetical protein